MSYFASLWSANTVGNKSSNQSMMNCSLKVIQFEGSNDGDQDLKYGELNDGGDDMEQCGNDEMKIEEDGCPNLLQEKENCDVAPKPGMVNVPMKNVQLKPVNAMLLLLMIMLM